jgi:hypothetical protein
MLTGTFADMECPVGLCVQIKETYFSTLCNAVLHIYKGIYLPYFVSISTLLHGLYLLIRGPPPSESPCITRFSFAHEVDDEGTSKLLLFLVDSFNNFPQTCQFKFDTKHTSTYRVDVYYSTRAKYERLNTDTERKGQRLKGRKKERKKKRPAHSTTASAVTRDNNNRSRV